MQEWGIDRKPIDSRFPKYNYQTVANSSFCYLGPWNSIEQKVRNSIILTFTSLSITQWENLLFMSTDCLVMQEWGIDRKPIDRRCQKYNFQTGVNSRFCYKGPWNSIEHQVRNSIILTFTSFSIAQLEKLAFYVHGLSIVMQEWGIDRMPIHRRFQKYNFQAGVNSSFCCKGPWNSIEQKVRNSIILTFTSVSITQREKRAFYVHGLSSYARMRHRQKAYWP
jgi:hypothetical protein